MRFILAILTAIAVFANLSLHAAAQQESPPQTPVKAERTRRLASIAEDTFARLRFAPMWLPVAASEMLPDPNAAQPVASAAVAMVCDADRHKHIELSAEQRQALHEINMKGIAQSAEQSERMKALSPEARAAEVESWGGKPAPWRQQFDDEITQQIKALLTPQQLEAVNVFTRPGHMVGFLYDAEFRRQINFSPEQEVSFRSVVKERLSQFQAEYLERADQAWDTLTPQQQKEIVEVVKKQGPTSATLAVAYHLGFDTDVMSLSYPLLAEIPVRQRMELSTEQEKQLQTVMADTAAWSREHLLKMPQADPNADQRRREYDKQIKGRIDAILTPQQLAKLEEIDFRRKVVLALGYPEKRASIGITAEQLAELERFDDETMEKLQRIDREMLAKALSVLTRAQRDQLATLIEQRIGL